MLSPKAKRWTYSQWNWVHLCNSWANLHCHLSLLKITWSSRVYRAHSTAQLFGKRLWNPQLGHQWTNKHTPWSSCSSVPCSPPHQNPSPSAVAGTISDYWYYYPEDGWGKWSSPARLPQFYEMKICLADSLGRKKRPPGKTNKQNWNKAKQNRKGCLGKLSDAAMPH